MTAPAGSTRRLLASLDSADQARLRAALQRAQQQGQPAWLVLPRADQLPLTAAVTSATTPAPTPVDTQARLRLRDPHAIDVDPAALQGLFGLTDAEATVASLLAAGWQPPQIAARLGVQPNTVAAHLKRVLAKTGAGRQAALVALLRGSVACRDLA